MSSHTRALTGSAFCIAVAVLTAVLVQPAYAGDSSAAAASLLAVPDDGGWSLEAMVAAGRKKQVLNARRDEVSNTDSCAARDKPGKKTRKQKEEKSSPCHEVQRLKAAMADARRDAHHTTREPTYVADAGALVKAQAALKDSESRVRTLSLQVESLKAGLAERDAHLRVLSGPQDELKQALAEKTAALEKRDAELKMLRDRLVQQEARVASLTPPPGEKERIESLTLALQDRDNALASALKQADESRIALKQLQNDVKQKDKAAQDLKTALDMRSRELKHASVTLAELRAKHNVSPSTPEQKQAYVAGLMMADGLNRRLEGWKTAGVKTDMTLFRSGIEDGLARTLRLKTSEARRAQAAFMKAVQDGVTLQIRDAQKQLASRAKGRTALKSDGGITWYRVRTGQTVAEGQPVRLSMTERVADGREVSRVPPLTLRPGDSVPSVVRDGMYLPGTGGEVVAYALARDVYGELPLPAGVQPWTVMEYHLKGEPLRETPSEPQQR